MYLSIYLSIYLSMIYNAVTQANIMKVDGFSDNNVDYDMGIRSVFLTFYLSI